MMMCRSKRTMAALLVAVGICGSIASPVEAEWAKKQAPVMTRFAKDVTPDKVLPEYPRPQLARQDWQNLNGLWEFQPGKEGDAAPFGKTLSSQILVPFPVESALSGVMEQHDRLWYRRTFSVPGGWGGKRIMLNFGAVDYEAEVFVNGKSLGTHKGGYDPFTFDITDALHGSGEQELIVRVYDPTANGGQPRGKQALHPGGIMYTSTSGIWQTVWLEPIAAGGIDGLKITPDVDGGRVKVTVNLIGENKNSPVNVAVKDGDRTVGIARGAAGQELSIKVPDAKLWSPDSPHLYDLVASAVGPNDAPVDSVRSYFGMRKIELGDDHGVKKILLNGKFTFQIGPLDQGFWPDGLYTPPSEEAIKNDLQMTKAMGFNFIRKHIKVEPARWYYWTDKLGLMVWQDMPSANSYTAKVPPVDKPEFESELKRMVEHLYNVPSIIMWVPFNEGQGQHDTEKLVAMVKGMDPTRLVNQASGGGHRGVGDVFDIHSYPPPRAPEPNAKMALVVGEYGGIGLRVEGHTWRPRGGGYVNAADPTDLLDKYSEFTNLLKQFRDENGLSAAVYTQTTDVETEINGLMTYDRIPKVPVELIAKANRFEIPPPSYKVYVPTSQGEPLTWRYTTEQPGGDAWQKTKFDDAAWKEAKAPFSGDGKKGTVWRTSDIWMRRTFTLPQLSSDELARLPLTINHDEGAEVFINGVLAAKTTGFNGHYENFPISEEARKALVPGGENTFAVHCHQTVGGQYIDVGMVERIAGLKLMEQPK